MVNFSSLSTLGILHNTAYKCTVFLASGFLYSISWKLLLVMLPFILIFILCDLIAVRNIWDSVYLLPVAANQLGISCLPTAYIGCN
jgi:hypothetical protein